MQTKNPSVSAQISTDNPFSKLHNLNGTSKLLSFRFAQFAVLNLKFKYNTYF